MRRIPRSGEPVARVLRPSQPDESARTFLGFAQPYLPARMAGTAGMAADEAALLNRIRGHAYLYLLAVIGRPLQVLATSYLRALDSDAGIHTLRAHAAESGRRLEAAQRLQKEFRVGFGTRCDLIGPPGVLSAAVTACSAPAIALTALHAELLLQQHRQAWLAERSTLDPGFGEVFRQGEVAEAAVLALAARIVAALAEEAGTPGGGRAVDEYLRICRMLDAGLLQQTAFDLDALQRAAGRTLSPVELEALRAAQHRASRGAYLESALTQPLLADCVERLAPGSRQALVDACADWR